ncbi:MAG: VIT1/CCC1 transporter family protein [Bacteroidetes bacterium]|nr:VIT1/CCC1 transporter family protein [Bacteroidota bacterium]
MEKHLHTDHHHEHHFTGNDIVRDVVIGMSDGLTVPFALAAGLSGAIDNTTIIVTAGLAEIAAGSIAMGLGGFLASKGDREHYDNELSREYREVQDVPEREAQEIIEIFEEYGITKEEATPVVEALKRNPDKWVDFMMKFELGLEQPSRKRAYTSALTIGFSYIVGGFIPLIPYMVYKDAGKGLIASAVITLIALFVFGIIKGRYTGTKPLKSGVETLLIGGIAAATAYFIASNFK